MPTEYCSTRNSALRLRSGQAILDGIAPDGGLYLPTCAPRIDWKGLAGHSDYPLLAARVLAGYLDDFSADELLSCAREAYGPRFGERPLALSKTGERDWALELWHGPTCAFKDMALQLMPRIFVLQKRKMGDRRRSVILVATSGDTGKAALEGFRDLEGTAVMVLYPYSGVSPSQRMQMVTQQGNNVFVAGIDGNFDDAQRTVKALLTDPQRIERLAQGGAVFSSANSINWGRLAPQIVYYFWAYAELLSRDEIAQGEKVDFVVPSGNFGDILAGYYARLAGLPVGRLVCASNSNDVLCDFINKGVYDARRDFRVTMSPSMDILVSSNVERLIFMISGGDSERVAMLYQRLAAEGRFELTPAERERVAEAFSAYSCGEQETAETIRTLYSKGYLADPHTAVGFLALQKHREAGHGAAAVVLSTASPFKFSGSVLRSLGENPPESGAEARLSQLTGRPVPAPLCGLERLPVRFDGKYGVGEVAGLLDEFLESLG